MRFSKNITMAAVLVALFSLTAHGQGGINHNMTPPQAPRAQPAPPPPPSLPQMPFIPPMVPVLPLQMAQPLPKALAVNVITIKAMEDKLLKLANEISQLESATERVNTNFYVTGDGSLAEAEGRISVLRYNIKIYQKELNNLTGQDLTNMPSGYQAIQKATIRGLYFMIAQREEEAAIWQSEKTSRGTSLQEKKKTLEDKRAEFKALQAAIQDMKDGKTQTVEGMTDKKTILLSSGEIGEDEFFEGEIVPAKSSETADIAPNKSMQELREDSLREAFSEMGSLNFQTGFLEKVDVAGQVSQTVIGFIPGMSGTDVALSGVRGFAEALGDEISKGTSWGDALSIAAVNAGIKGAVSIVGNKLTGGADKLANRVAVLTEVGFSKLTTKQVAEYGAKGISFLVVKSGQVVGQTAVEEFAGKPAMKKIADAIKSAKHVSGGSASGGGYGMSVATQPLVAY